MPGVSNIRKLNTVRLKTENVYVTFSMKMLKSFRLNVLTEHVILRLLGSAFQQKDPEQAKLINVNSCFVQNKNAVP